MAHKKPQPNRTWLRTLLWVIMVPLTVWFAAFWVWLYWYDLRHWIAPGDGSPPRMKPPLQEERSTNRGRSPTQPKETIFEEDRRKLEEILKQRS